MKMKETDPLDAVLNGGQDEDDLVQQDLKTAYASSIETRLLPVTTLGSSHTTLPDKLSALLHSLKFEVGENFLKYCVSVAVCTSNQGPVEVLQCARCGWVGIGRGMPG